jgi:hypothetical protein
MHFPDVAVGLDAGNASIVCHPITVLEYSYIPSGSGALSILYLLCPKVALRIGQCIIEDEGEAHDGAPARHKRVSSHGS